MGAGFLSQRGAQIPLAGGRRESDDHLAGVLRSACDLERGTDVGPAGDAAEDAFLLGQAARHHKGFIVADPDALGDLVAAVLALEVEIARDKAGPGALNLVRTGRQLFAGQRLRDHRRVGRLHRYGLK